MENKLTIRPGRIEDIDAIWAMFGTVKKQLAHDNIPIWNDDYPERQDFENDLRIGGLLVAEQAGEIIGAISHNADLIGEYFFDAPDEAAARVALQKMLDFCGLHSAADTVSAHRLMVMPGRRHGGVAAALLKAMERANAGKDIVFFAAPFNVPALRLYAAQGYRDLGSYVFSFGEMHCLVKTAVEAAR